VRPGRTVAGFDLIDAFIAAHGIDPAVAEEANALLDDPSLTGGATGRGGGARLAHVGCGRPLTGDGRG